MTGAAALKAARYAIIAVLTLGTIAAWLNSDLLQPLSFARAIGGKPFSGPLFIIVQLVAGLIFVPRTVTGIAAGLIFGPRWGFIWLMIGTVLGSAAGFLLGRKLGSQFHHRVSRALPRVGPLLTRAESCGWKGVAAFRLIPGIPYSFTNYAMGLTGLSFGDYLLGSLIGQIPSSAIYAVAGGEGADLILGSPSWLGASVIDLALLLAASSVVVLVWYRGRQAARPALAGGSPVDPGL